MESFLDSELGQAVLAVAVAAVSAAFAAAKGSDIYQQRTNRRQRLVVDLVAKAVAYVYSNYVRPQKAANKDGKLTEAQKHTAENAAVQFVVEHAEKQGVKIPSERIAEVRGDIVAEVARVKAEAKGVKAAKAVRTTPSTKGGI